MKEINVNNLKIAAEKICLNLKEEEYQQLAEKMQMFMKQFKEIIIDDLTINEYKPISFPFHCQTDFLREDTPDYPLTREKMLKNTRNALIGQIKFPKNS